MLRHVNDKIDVEKKRYVYAMENRDNADVQTSFNILSSFTFKPVAFEDGSLRFWPVMPASNN
jgi:hypothetical protein